MQWSLSSQMQLPWAHTQPDRADKNCCDCNSKQKLSSESLAPPSPSLVQPCNVCHHPCFHPQPGTHLETNLGWMQGSKPSWRN